MKVTHIIKEMAVTRSEGIASCIILGHKFYEHFYKIYLEGIYSNDFKHHCGEMSGWFNSVIDMVFSYNKKRITDDQIYRWFFLAGSELDVLFNDSKEAFIYNKFVKILLKNKSESISDLLIKILGN